MPLTDRSNPLLPSRALETLTSALALLRRTASPLGTECATLAQAGGRILAEPLYARIDSPRRDAAAMDGFALAESPEGAPELRWRLVAPEETGDAGLVTGSATRVATGASLPKGTIRVLPIEHAHLGEGYVSFAGEPGTRAHIRRCGSDFRRDELVLAAGRKIDPRALVAIASADVGMVPVLRSPRVAIIVLGSDQVDPGEAATSEQAVPDSLGQALLLFADSWGGVPLRSIRVGENVTALASAVVSLQEGVDVIVLVGGAAHSARSATHQALASLGLVLGFDGLAVRPGRPSWYGTIGTTHVLGLPGNPTAAMTLARLLLAPLLETLGGGDANSALAWEDLPLAEAAVATGDRESFLCAVSEANGVRLFDRADVSGQRMLAAADRLVARPAFAPALAAGTRVPTLRF